MKKLLILSSLLLSLVSCGNVVRVQNTCLKEDTIYFSSVKMFYFSKGYAYSKTYDFKKKKIYIIDTIKDNRIELKATSEYDYNIALSIINEEEYVFESGGAKYKEDKEGFFSLKDFDLFV